MDIGKVTVAEIGDIKREIAYHGDVLNTAARLQEQCKKFKSNLLISHNMKTALPEARNGYIQKLVGDLKLRGKQQDIKVYSVEQKIKNTT
jgi:adenylate cyclase